MNIQRLSALIRKEFIQIIRDPSAIAIAFVLPLVLLFLFGYGVSLDSYHVPIAIVDDMPTTATSSFVADLQQSPFFDPTTYETINEAKNAMMENKVNGILWLRDNFSREIFQSSSAPIGVFVNGSDANNAHILEGYFSMVWQTWLQSYTQGLGMSMASPVDNQYRIWFNPALRSRDYLVPGLIALIMTLIGALLTSLVVAREWERGTMEALMASPVTMSEILLGKLIPYFTLGMGGMLLSVFLAISFFAVPLRGSFWVLFSASALFLVTALGMGLLISTVARNQFVASQTAIIVTYLPAFILSGFIFDIQSMPWIIQLITNIIPAKHFVSILQSVFLAGDIWTVILWDSFILLIMSSVFFGLTIYRSHKRLD